MAIKFILLVLISPGLSIPELTTAEEDGIAVISFENPPLELISTRQNKADVVESPYVQNTSIAKLELIPNWIYTEHLAHKACSKSQLLLIFLQGFCPSQLNNTLLLILISSLSTQKKKKRFKAAITFCWHCRDGPHPSLPAHSYCSCLGPIHSVIHSTNIWWVSTLCQPFS